VATARDLKAHPIIDYLFGPLICQIEHHLFPTIPITKLRAAQAVVKPFCASRSIPYHETGVVQALGEVWRHVHAIGKALR
jgi:fatty acid desaturase